jgi:hypothetical protein
VLMEFIDQLRQRDRGWFHSLSVPLAKKPILCFRKLHRLRALFVIIHDRVDPAHRIAAHQPSVVGLQQSFRRMCTQTEGLIYGEKEAALV